MLPLAIVGLACVLVGLATMYARAFTFGLAGVIVGVTCFAVLPSAQSAEPAPVTGYERLFHIAVPAPMKNLASQQEISSPAVGGTRVYIIQRGDTLWSLARRFHTTVRRLVRLNGIQNPNLIYAGRRLRIPAGDTPAPSGALYRNDSGWDNRLYTYRHPGVMARYLPWSANWREIARCESTLRWNCNTGNGFYGGLQFTKSTWDWYGGRRFNAWPHHATVFEQKVMAERVLHHGFRGRPPQGIGAWPNCGRYGYQGVGGIDPDIHIPIPAVP